MNIMHKVFTNDWLCRTFESNIVMSFKINDKQLLKKYNQIWKRVEKLLKIESDSKPVYGGEW